jgi:hypothetical protein
MIATTMGMHSGRRRTLAWALLLIMVLAMATVPGAAASGPSTTDIARLSRPHGTYLAGLGSLVASGVTSR